MMKMYDRTISNRQNRDIRIGELSKEASESVLTAIHGEGFDQEAAFQAVDMVTKTKRMVQSSLGVDDARAAEAASILLGKANKIHERFGGNLEVIVREMVEKMTEQTADRGPSLAKDGINVAPDSFRPLTRGELARHIEKRIDTQFGWSGLNAALVRNVTDLTNSLSTEFHKSRIDVANAILDLYAEHEGVAPEALFKKDLDPEIKRELRRRIEEGV